MNMRVGCRPARVCLVAVGDFVFFFFFFNDTATTEIYTLSLHDALPIWLDDCMKLSHCAVVFWSPVSELADAGGAVAASTSGLTRFLCFSVAASSEAISCEKSCSSDNESPSTKTAARLSAGNSRK